MNIKDIELHLHDIKLNRCEASSGGGIMVVFLPNSEIIPDLKNINIENCIADIGSGIRMLREI